MKEIKWNVKRVWLAEMSKRTRKNQWTKNIDEYAVVAIRFFDDYDGNTLAPEVEKRHKKITLMVFKEEIYKRLIVGDRFSFGGFISFGYGNTFLVVKKAFDDLGFDIESEESMYFANYSPKVE